MAFGSFERILSELLDWNFIQDLVKKHRSPFHRFRLQFQAKTKFGQKQSPFEKERDNAALTISNAQISQTPEPAGSRSY